VVLNINLRCTLQDKPQTDNHTDSASEFTVLWRYINLSIIIIINRKLGISLVLPKT